MLLEQSSVDNGHTAGDRKLSLLALSPFHESITSLRNGDITHVKDAAKSWQLSAHRIGQFGERAVRSISDHKLK